MKAKMKMKKLALLLSAALMSTCPQMDSIAAETVIRSETLETAEQPETEIFSEDEMETDADNEDLQTVESSMDEAE